MDRIIEALLKKERIATNVSGAFFNLNADAGRDLTQCYDTLRVMTPTRNTTDVAHENGPIEGSRGHLKRAIPDVLLLLGSADTVDLVGYRGFIDTIRCPPEAGRAAARASVPATGLTHWGRASLGRPMACDATAVVAWRVANGASIADTPAIAVCRLRQQSVIVLHWRLGERHDEKAFAA